MKKPEKMADIGIFKATETERVPSAYYILPGNQKAVLHLRAHGIDFIPKDCAHPHHGSRRVPNRDQHPGAEP